MDPQELYEVFIGTYSPVKEVRNHAEAVLKESERSQGFLVALFAIIMENEIDMNVRKAASVYFKNMCGLWDRESENGEGYEESEGADQKQDSRKYATLFGEEDKWLVRENIVAGLIRSPSQLKSLLGACFREIACCDYPENWPSLEETLLQSILNSTDASVVYGGLYTLQRLLRNFKFKIPEKRGPVERLAELFSEPLVSIGERLIVEIDRGAESAVFAGEMFKLICKSFYVMTNLTMPKVFQDQKRGLFDAWMTMLLRGFVQPVPQSQLHSNSGTTSVAWKIRIWITKIFCRVLQRWGDVESAPSKNVKKFASRCQETFAAPLCEAILEMCFKYYCSQEPSGFPRTLFRHCLHYLEIAVPFRSTWTVMKGPKNGTLEKIIFSLVLPALSLTSEDLLLWREDVGEYVRRQFDPSSLFVDPLPTAENLLCDLIKDRTNAVLPIIARHVSERLGVLAIDSRDLSLKEALELEMTFHVVGISSRTLAVDKNAVSGILAPLVSSRLFPAFESPFPFLRARACWLTGRLAADYSLVLSDLNGRGKKLDSATVNAHLSFLADALLAQVVIRLVAKDPEVPVRVEAIQALPHLLGSELHEVREDVLSLLETSLDDIFQQFFLLVREIGHDDCMATLTLIIDKLGLRIVNSSEALLSRIAETFREMCMLMQQESQRFTAGSAAVECLRSVDTLLEAVKNSPDVFVRLAERVIAELIFPATSPSLLGPDLMEFTDEAATLCLTIFFFAPYISPAMWQCYENILNAHGIWGTDFVKELINPIHVLFHREHAVFFEHPELVQRLLHLGLSTLSSQEVGEADAQHAAKLVSSIFNHAVDSPMAKDVLAGFIPVVLDTVAETLQKCEGVHLETMLISVYASVCHCTPLAAVVHWESKGETHAVLCAWVKQTKRLIRKYDHVVSMIGLLTLLMATNNEGLPVSIQIMVPKIVRSMVKSMAKYVATDDFLDDDDSDDSIDEEISGLIEDGAEESSTSSCSDGGEDGTIRDPNRVDWEELAAEFEDFDDLELEIFPSPIDNIDYLVFFIEGWFELMKTEAYSVLFSQFSPTLRKQWDIVDKAYRIRPPSAG